MPTPARRVAALTVAVVAALLPLASSPTGSAVAGEPRGSAAAPVTIVSARDARGDVRLTAGDGPSASLRRSIDVRRLTIAQVGDRVRFEVRIRRVLPVDQSFDQMVLMTIEPAPGSTETWRGDVGFAVQQPRSAFAYADQDGTGSDLESCDPLTSRSQPSSRVLYLDVPAQCVPSGEAKVRLRSVAGYFRSDAGFFASDTMTVPGLVTLP